MADIGSTGHVRTELTPSNANAYNDAKIFEKHVKPVILAFMVLASRASGCFFGHPNP